MDDDLPPLPPAEPGRYRHYKGGVFQAPVEVVKMSSSAGRV